MSLRRTLTLALSIAALLAPAAARAAEVTVESVPPTLAASAVAARVEAEIAPLNREGVVTIAFDDAAGTLRVRFTPREGAPVERVVTTPASDEERVRAASWLAYNLVRDEASDLLGELARQRPAPPPPPEPEPEVIGPPAPAPAPPTPRRPCDLPGPSQPLSLAFLSPVSWPTRPAQTNLGIGLIYADARAVDGFAVSGGVQRVRCDVGGATVAAAASFVEGRLDGVAVAGGFHQSGERVRGAVVSGAMAWSRGEVEGALVAPLTLTERTMSGAALGMVHVATAPVVGAQLGAGNFASELQGLQIALLNVGGPVSGAQIGVVNVATGDVKGAQLGLVNVNRDADAAVGLYSLSWTRRIRFVAWTSTIRAIQVGVLLEGKWVFSTINFGRLVDLVADGNVILGAEIGVHLVRSEDKGLVLDVVGGIDSQVGGNVGTPIDVSRLGARVGYRLIERFAPYLYGGAALKGASQADGSPPTHLKLIGEVGGGAIF